MNTLEDQKKSGRGRVALRVGLFAVLCLFLGSSDLMAQGPGSELLDGDITKAAELTKEDYAPPIKVVLLLTAMTFIPALLMTMTSFTRIIIVLSFVRKALSVQEMPPNQVMVGLALFLSFVIMQPVGEKVWDEAIQPYNDKEITLQDAAQNGMGHLSKWMLTQTSEKDLLFMVELTGIEKPDKPEDVPLHVLIPAFSLSELRIAFQMGFLIYLPFLIVDLVVSSILLSMGMFMLPPVIISTPFKILLFVLVDGWNIVIRSLVTSFNAAG